MFARTLAATALALAAFAQTPALAADAEAGPAKALEVCTAQNGPAPVEHVATVEDGLGDLAVWLKDAAGDLWLCNASAQGAVYANIRMEGDLLKGAGADLISYAQVSNRNRGRADSNPAASAEALCAKVGSYLEDMQVVATVEDGVGDYLVWLKNANEALWMCNASGDGKLYGFEPVDTPINDFVAVELRFA